MSAATHRISAQHRATQSAGKTRPTVMTGFSVPTGQYPVLKPCTAQIPQQNPSSHQETEFPSGTRCEWDCFVDGVKNGEFDDAAD